MSTTDTYNGWSNRATWLVALHIDNTEETQEYAKENLTLIYKQGQADTYMTSHDSGLYAATEFLQEWVEDLLDGLNDGNAFNQLLARDLINSYLGEVNWKEIATNILEEVLQKQEAA